jgi:hypothetical protein
MIVYCLLSPNSASTLPATSTSGHTIYFTAQALLVLFCVVALLSYVCHFNEMKQLIGQILCSGCCSSVAMKRNNTFLDFGGVHDLLFQ